MISQTDSTAGRGQAPQYVLEAALCYLKPRIWRRLQVPGDANLGWLHAVLQVAMGWTNSHLHQFSFSGQTYSDPAFALEPFRDGPPVKDESKATLMKVAEQVGDTLEYEYDFGDSWRHQVTIEEILPADPSAANIAVCLDGARACPPEDCGSLPGYENLCTILKDRKHPEHKRMKQWLGRPFDAEAFDAAKINVWLRKLKSPRPTEAQLRKVLMGRDGYHE